jgi:hypothetical protein
MTENEASQIVGHLSDAQLRRLLEKQSTLSFEESIEGLLASSFSK